MDDEQEDSYFMKNQDRFTAIPIGEELLAIIYEGANMHIIIPSAFQEGQRTADMQSLREVRSRINMETSSLS